MKAICVKVLSEIATILLLAIRPFLGPATCCYTVSCTKFAQWQLANEPFHKALWAITKRLISCSPLSLFFWHSKLHS